MKGVNTIGWLAIEVFKANSLIQQWNISGHQGNDWLCGQLYLFDEIVDTEVGTMYMLPTWHSRLSCLEVSVYLSINRENEIKLEENRSRFKLNSLIFRKDASGLSRVQ